jgi:hypothetical protein
MYERRGERLLTRAEFAARWLVHFLVAIGFVVLSLAAGMLGFVYFENKHVHSFHDALLNASMLLGGMGPIHIPETPGGKLFAALYALYAGLVFLGVMGLLFAPVLHRLLHHFHSKASSDTGRRTPVEPKSDAAG